MGDKENFEMTTTEDGIVKVIGCLLGSFITLIGMALSAWCGQIMWNYVCPLWHGPHVTFLQAFVVLGLLGMLKNVLFPNKSK